MLSVRCHLRCRGREVLRRSYGPGMARQPFDVVFLDAGGVLVHPHRDRVLNHLRAAGVDVDADHARLTEAHYHGVRAIDAVRAAPETFDEYQRGYIRHLGFTGYEADHAVQVLAELFGVSGLWCDPLPFARAGLDAIAATGVPIVIVSNADGTVEGVLQATGLLQVGPGSGVEVAAVVDSGAVGFAKPDPRIFEAALELIAATPERALHVGDSFHYDVLGARAAGVHPVLVDPFDLRGDEDCDRVTDLAAVAALLH